MHDLFTYKIRSRRIEYVMEISDRIYRDHEPGHIF